jgi:hypothetical protein
MADGTVPVRLFLFINRMNGFFLKTTRHLRVRKTFLLNLAVCLASISLLVFGAEVVIRVARGDIASSQKKYPQGLYCESHPLFGWLGKPHATGTVSWASPDMDAMHVVMNEKGFWDKSHLPRW